MKAVLDACVIYPTVLREILTGVAALGLYEPLWSDRILREWTRATLSVPFLPLLLMVKSWKSNGTPSILTMESIKITVSTITRTQVGWRVVAMPTSTCLIVSWNVVMCSAVLPTIAG